MPLNGSSHGKIWTDHRWHHKNQPSVLEALSTCLHPHVTAANVPASQLPASVLRGAASDNKRPRQVDFAPNSPATVPCYLFLDILFDERSDQWAVPRCIGLADVSHLYQAGLPVQPSGIKANFY